jgi:L-seryl-tRNA(Ser) seleniumtransferase
MGIYERLGVRTLINARGTATALGGTLMPPEVLQAMYEASQAFVDLSELLQRAGERIAELIGVEAAHVSSGAAGGMVLAAAACILDGNRGRINDLPDTTGLKTDIIIPKCHRFGYDQSFRQAGAKLIEVGTQEGTSPEDVQTAINENTAAIAYIIAFADAGKISLAEVIRVAKSANVPVIVDAASELPPATNLTKYWQMGADLSIFSGGKGLMGPQCSGLILGRKTLIDMCAASGNPHAGIGRGMKVGKEEIAGLVAAVELYINRDHAADLKHWEHLVDNIINELQDVPHLKAKHLPVSESSRQMPYALITFDEESLGLTKADIANLLQTGEPSIRFGETGNGILLNPHTLQDGEEKIIANRIKEIVQSQV